MRCLAFAFVLNAGEEIYSDVLAQSGFTASMNCFIWLTFKGTGGLLLSLFCFNLFLHPLPVQLNPLFRKL